MLSLLGVVCVLAELVSPWQSDLGLTLTDPSTLMFVVQVEIGGQHVPVEIDTGSTRSWVPWFASSTLSATTTPFAIAYRDGSMATGVLATDLVRFGSEAPTRRFVFGLVNDTTIAGYCVIGFRPPQLAEILDGADEPLAAFAFAERRLSLGRGPQGGLAWVASSTTRWAITAETIRFGTLTASEARLHVDTGAAIVGVPDVFYSQLSAALGADSNGFVRDCDRRRQWWPSLQIELGAGRRLTYPPGAWTRPVTGHPGLCRVVLRPAGGEWILGVPLLMQQEVAFRVRTRDQAEIGFRI